MKRTQLSGSQKRKLAEEKKQKHEESLQNVPKINDMFSGKVAKRSRRSEIGATSDTTNSRDEGGGDETSAAAATIAAEANIEPPAIETIDNCAATASDSPGISIEPNPTAVGPAGSKKSTKTATTGPNAEHETRRSKGNSEDDTLDFEDDYEQFSLNVSTSSRHRDIEHESESEYDCESTKSSKRADPFPTDAACWNVADDLSALQRYWTILGSFFVVSLVFSITSIFSSF